MNKKNLLVSVFSLCLMAMCWFPMAAQNSAERGDVNNDGAVSIQDVSVLISYLLNGDDASVNRSAADVNMDGAVTIKDVTELISYLLNGELTPPYEPEYKTVTVGSGTSAVTFRMLLVQGGTFMMGAREGDPYVRPWESPVHQVTLSDYYIAEFEVTQALWRAVMGTSSSNNPSWFCSTNGYANNYQRPAENMIYSQVTSFITKLNQKTGMTFRLPTEAEWEFAARGGNWSKGYLYIGGDDVYEVAWQSDNSDDITYPVGTKAPNELGLYDMGGNVEEWCSDWYGLYNEGAQVNPTGVSSSSTNSRVMRGGSWDQSYRMCRPTSRHDANVAFKSAHSGMRLAMSK